MMAEGSKTSPISFVILGFPLAISDPNERWTKTCDETFGPIASFCFASSIPIQKLCLIYPFIPSGLGTGIICEQCEEASRKIQSLDYYGIKHTETIDFYRSTTNLLWHFQSSSSNRSSGPLHNLKPCKSANEYKWIPALFISQSTRPPRRDSRGPVELYGWSALMNPIYHIHGVSSHPFSAVVLFYSRVNDGARPGTARESSDATVMWVQRKREFSVHRKIALKLSPDHFETC